MLDIGWSELLVVAVIALVIVGPKELPALLRMIGKYMGLIKRQAQEFRSQFDEAIKDTEFEQVKQDFQDIKSDAEATLRDASRGIEDEMRDLDDISREVDRELDKSLSEPDADAGGDGDGDWRDVHNQAILEAEEEARAEAMTTVEQIDDPGAADGADEPATKTAREAASQKAGAAT